MSNVFTDFSRLTYLRVVDGVRENRDCELIGHKDFGSLSTMGQHYVDDLILSGRVKRYRKENVSRLKDFLDI